MSDEHFRRLHGKVLRRLTTPIQLPVSHEGGGPGYVHEVQAESRVPQLEKELAEARLKLAELAKEHHMLAAQAKKVPQLEVKVEDLKHFAVLQRSVHEAKVEGIRAGHNLEVK